MLSGLLSLNVHEALQFEGTELCLHPDIFLTQEQSKALSAPDNNHASSVSSVRSSFATSNVVGGSQSRLMRPSAAAIDENSIVTTPTQVDKQKLDDERLLHVGDMIEIRVWDPIGGDQRGQLPFPSAAGLSSSQQNTPNTVLRKQPRQPSTAPRLSTASAPLLNMPSTGLPDEETLNIPSSPYPKSLMDKQESLPNSDTRTESPGVRTPRTSPNPSPVVSPGNQETKSNLATSKTLPPTFPRVSRTSLNTAGLGGNSMLNENKPSLLQRKQSSDQQSLPSTVNTNSNSGGDSAYRFRTPSSSLIPKPRHDRSISDISTDSAVFGGSSHRSGLVIDATGKPQNSMESPSEDDDDMWTAVSSTHNLRLSFVILVTEKSLTSLKTSSRTHISVLRQVADLYKLSSYDMVTVHRLVGQEADKALKAVSADFVTVTIKDQFLSRGELHFFQNALIGSWIYEGQRLFEPTRGIHANARDIRHDGAHANSGIVTDSTKIAFRSRSSRIFWLIQISVEMWDYAPPFSKKESHCEIYFDRFISFIYDLFEKWKKAEVTHSLTVVFFSRTYIQGGVHGSTTPRDLYGRLYEDHCRVVLENETRTDWDKLVVPIKEAFLRYPEEVGWTLSPKNGETRQPSTAAQGNILEAVNVTLNLLQYHYLDRDLHRSGNSIVIVSAGNGVFEVDKKLSSITYQRMMDNGIGSDMLSLGLPPLHISPFFLFFNETHDKIESVIPHWIHLSFVSYDSDSNLVTLNPETETQSATVVVSDERVLDIGPNGFLRKRATPSVNTTPKKGEISKKTFSQHGNDAASPGRKAKNLKLTRHLADRDFRDILEACRHRVSGSMPRPLKALLKMYAATDKKQQQPSIVEQEAEALESNIREWNDVSLDQVQGQALVLPSSLGRNEHSSPVLMPMTSPYVEDDNSSSQPSSYTSEFASRIMGTSYERHVVIRTESKTGSSSMQRSPSLDMTDFLDKFPVQRTESNDKPDGIGKEDDAEFVAMMKSHMERHDHEKMLPPVESPSHVARAELDRSSISDSTTRQATPSRASIINSRTRNPAAISETGPSLSPSGSPSGGVGGIGAALSDYSEAGNAPIFSELDASGTLPRSSSASRMIRIGEVAPHGLSPLFLPPAKAPTSNSSLSLESLNSSTHGQVSVFGSADRRFIRPAREHSRGRPLESLSSDTHGLSPDSTSSRSRNTLGFSGHSNAVESPRVSASPGLEPRGVRTRPRSGSGGRSAGATSSRRTSPSPVRTRSNKRETSTGSSGSQNSKIRRRKAINPFRQQEEDDVLAQKSHNSRRWSHVFPQGEIEFKRKSGPNWKSLSAPAILPLSIDYFPSYLEREHNFTFSIYNVSLSEFERSHFSSNKELLLEMVRQRITQDYQFVPASIVDERGTTRRGGMSRTTNGPGSLRMYLSIGHRLQVLNYDPSSDTVEVTTYLNKNSQGGSVGSYEYFYNSFCRLTGTYTKIQQNFNQYTSQYNWSKVDRIICGDEDREMREGMRFKRLMFALLPDRHTDAVSENAYVEKFKKLLEYFEKLREKDLANVPLKVKVVTNRGTEQAGNVSPVLSSTPGIEGKSMVRFYVQLRKGKKDQFEYLEVSIDSTFNTMWSYRIMFNWFVASSGKVDAQVQLLQRRCTQFRLNLIQSSEVSVSKTLFLNPFRAPAVFLLKEASKVTTFEDKLAQLDYIHDGVFLTSRDFTDCIDDASEFQWGHKFGKPLAGRQVMHRSGLLFVRMIEDKNGKAVVFAFANLRYSERDQSLQKECDAIFDELCTCINNVINS